MKPDGTDSFSTANEDARLPMGTQVTGSTDTVGAEVKPCSSAAPATWSYLFVHHSRVAKFEEWLRKDGKTFFVHKTIRYYRKNDKLKVQRREIPTFSGLVFIKGSPKETQAYLDWYFPGHYLCKNCSTGRVAQIPDSQMRPFMCICETSPERIRFLLHPFHYYARNRILLRITTGNMADMTGYIIRIDRDRKLVMEIGGMSVAISGVHAERFEEVEPAKTTVDSDVFYKRNLHEQQVLIDRYFHPVKTTKEVYAQADNIEYLRKYVLDEMAHNRMKIHEAWRTLQFVIEEIGYYYAPIADHENTLCAPIFSMGAKVLQELERLVDTPNLDESTRIRFQSDYQQLLTSFSYLF